MNTATWVLMVWIYSPVNSPQVSGMALVTVPGFNSQSDCRDASDMAWDMVNGTDRIYKYACVKQPPIDPATADKWRTR